MKPENAINAKQHKRSRKGILFGIPLLLFIGGIVLLTIGTYKYLTYAFYLSRLFIHKEVKPSTNLTELLEEKGTGDDTGIDGREPDSTTNGSSDVVRIKFPMLGEEYGTLKIDSVSLEYPVYHGDREKELVKGIGHYNGSRFPGEGGNIVLVGHRNTVFRDLEFVQVGDSVVFETTYGEYEYVISDIRITGGNDKSIVQPSNYEKLTLYTCYPFVYIGRAPKRYVVTCDLVNGIPLKELMAKGADIP
jgi:sortase A